MKPILGFAPDADATTPGMLFDCAHVIPYESGMRGAPTPAATTADPLPAESRGAAVLTKLAGTRRVFAGTQTALYELTGTAWTDRSPAPFVGSTESRWSFCQFGDTALASNLTDPMQGSAAGAFADVPTAPKAKIIVSASNNFVLAFHTNDLTYGDSPDRWWCCAQSNQNDWVPDVSTGANTGRLISVEGPLQAALPLGDYVVAYKQRAIYLGRYVGGAEVWRWTLIPGGEAGAVGQDAVCDIGGKHFIVGNDNFWIFDGTRPVPLGDGINRQWFLDNSSPTYRYKTQVSYDRQNKLVRVHYPSRTSSGACDACLVYHLSANKWGRDDLVIESPLNYIAPGVTIDGLDAYAATIDALPNIPLDSQFWLAGGQVPAFFNAAHQLVSLNGETADSSMTTGDMGGDDAVMGLERFRIRFAQSPRGASATGYFKMNEGDPLIQGATNAINDGKFDIRQSARFHRVRIDLTGPHKATAYDAKLNAEGGR